MYDVIIIGAGPSGLMSAINIENEKVLLLEKNESIGKKLLLTGGGRCNLTNNAGKKKFLENVNDKNFFIKSYSEFNNLNLINYFKHKGLKLKIEGEKVFVSSGGSRELISFFDKEIQQKSNVTLKLNEEVIEVDFKDNYVIKTNNNSYESKSLVISTGGISYPITGSNGFGYKVAEKFGHKITNLYSAEAKVFTEENHNLSGQTVGVKITFENKEEDGSMLFTHDGLSGEPILNLSEHLDKSIKEGKESYIEIDFIPNQTAESLSTVIDSNEGKQVKEVFKGMFQKRILEYLMSSCEDKKIAEMSRKERNELIYSLKSKKIKIKAVIGVEKAIATSGGIRLEYINPKTYESKLASNLYFGGETLNLHGKVGGFNLSIAFISGYLIAKALKKE